MSRRQSPIELVEPSSSVSDRTNSTPLKAEYCQLCDKETADNVFRLQLNVPQGANHDSDAVYVVRDGSQGRRCGGDEGWKLQNNLA
jgi:hypothetical protein